MSSPQRRQEPVPDPPRAASLTEVTAEHPALPEGDRGLRRRRALVPGLVVLVLVAVGAGVVISRRSSTPARPRFETMAVERGRLTARITANGTLSALVTVQVGSQVSGRIQRLDVDFNATVRRGQVIAQIDPLLFRAAVESARANLAAARGNLARAEAQAVEGARQYERARALLERRTIAPADVDTAEATSRAATASVAAARGTVAQAQAALHQAEVNLGYTTIVSPIDGVVISRNVDVGQTVAAAFQSPTLFLIAEDLRKMQVDTSVAEADVGRLREGMPATFTVDAYPSDVFRGVIRQVRKNPQTVQNVVTYDAVIDVANDEVKLFPGMTANTTVVYADRPDAIQIPNAALRYQPPGASDRPRPPTPAGERVVWRLAPGAAAPEAVRVRLGVSDGSRTELLGGNLAVGDQLVIEAINGPRASGPGSFGRVF